jgi:U3 small nucleolar RNA-associated protein 12
MRLCLLSLPRRFVLDTIRAIRPAELDQALLALPFTDAMYLLRMLHHVIRRGIAVELASKCILFLMKLHHRQVRLRLPRIVDCLGGVQ